MNPTLFEIVVALIMVAVIATLVVWFFKNNAAISGRRMLRMLTRAGVDPELAKSGDAEAIMRDVRSRCLGCRAEALCATGDPGAPSPYCDQIQQTIVEMFWLLADGWQGLGRREVEVRPWS